MPCRVDRAFRPSRSLGYILAWQQPSLFLPRHSLSHPLPCHPRRFRDARAWTLACALHLFPCGWRHPGSSACCSPVAFPFLLVPSVASSEHSLMVYCSTILALSLLISSWISPKAFLEDRGKGVIECESRGGGLSLRRLPCASDCLGASLRCLYVLRLPRGVNGESCDSTWHHTCLDFFLYWS